MSTSLTAAQAKAQLLGMLYAHEAGITPLRLEALQSHLH